MTTMYNDLAIKELISLIHEYDGITDKSKLISIVASRFSLVKDRSVYYSKDYAIRFSQSKTLSFSNTVLSLSNLQKYDNNPFFVCLVTPTKNVLFLANTTLLLKISHSSQQLREDNIKGSFNGSDILRSINGIENSEENFELLFTLHEGLSFEENLKRLVESTNQIVGRDLRYKRSLEKDDIILNSVKRASLFVTSPNYLDLATDLEKRTRKVENEIVIASLIGNVNIRGRVIEYLITHGESDGIRNEVIKSLQEKRPLPDLYTDDDLGDYNKSYESFNTKTDIKTKVLFFNSAPKAYNIDKLLDFLSSDKSVYLIYFIGIGEDQSIKTFLCSLFDSRLLDGTVVQFHWAGRNSRGVSQLTGSVIDDILYKKKNDIDEDKATKWLRKLLDL